jgi:hypothetical protein
MNIGTYQQFYTLIKDDLPAIALPLGDCISATDRICSCKKEAKQNKSNSCNQIYIDFIKNCGEGLKEYFATKTADNEVVFNHSTHHPILRLTLR